MKREFDSPGDRFRRHGQHPTDVAFRVLLERAPRLHQQPWRHQQGRAAPDLPAALGTYVQRWKGRLNSRLRDHDVSPSSTPETTALNDEQSKEPGAEQRKCRWFGYDG
tara:strand:- start:116 stop:439 length:324 start_codon:yes stop_codon:yes gene_type:complete